MTEPERRSGATAYIVRSVSARGLWPATLLLCALLPLLQHASGLSPVSLYIDDQWVAALVVGTSVRELVMSPAPVPVGFRLLERLADNLLGPGVWALQVVPLIAMLALVPATAWLGRKVTGSALVGVVAAILLTLSPPINELATRLKPYTLDALCVVILAGLADTAFASRGRRDYARFVGFALVAALFSSSSLMVSLPWMAVVIWRGRHDLPSRLTLALGFLAFTGLYFVSLAPQASPAMHEFWLNHLLPISSLEAATSFLRVRAPTFFGAAFPTPSLAYLLPLGLLSLAARRRSRPAALGIILLVVALLALSAAGAYPFGGYRTDAFVHPLLLLAAAAPLSWLEFVPGVRALTPLAAVTLVAATLVRGPTLHEYPGGDDALAARSMCASIRPDDALVVYPHSTWAIAYFCRWPTEAVPSQYFSHNFQLHFPRPHTVVLAEGADGVGYWKSAPIIDASLRRFLRQPSRQRLHFVGTMQRHNIEGRIFDTIRAFGYEVERERRNPSGAVHMIFRRTEATAGGAEPRAQ